jgi:hypothetical protein
VDLHVKYLVFLINRKHTFLNFAIIRCYDSLVVKCEETDRQTHRHTERYNKVKGRIFNVLSYLRSKNELLRSSCRFHLPVCVCVRLCVCVFMFNLFQLLKYPIDFHEIWYEHYACGGHLSAVLLSYIRTIGNNRKTHEILAWERK